MQFQNGKSTRLLYLTLQDRSGRPEPAHGFAASGPWGKSEHAGLDRHSDPCSTPEAPAYSRDAERHPHADEPIRRYCLWPNWVAGGGWPVSRRRRPELEAESHFGNETLCAAS